MAKHTANTAEAVARFEAVESARSNYHPSDELDCALDDDFEQMSMIYTPKNTEVSTS